MNAEEAKAAFLGALGEAKDRLVDGAESDRDEYLELLATDYGAAAAEGDTEGMQEVLAQGKALAGSHRVRLNDELWDMMLVGLKVGVAVLA